MENYDDRISMAFMSGGIFMEQIRVGIVGIGNMGSAHALNIFQNKVDGMRLTAVCDVRGQRLKWAQEQFGEQVICYSDYQKMLLTESLDAVIIATPHKLHPVIAEAALRSGHHVLTEKPAGIDVASVCKMNEAAAESGKVFAIMFNQRTNPLFRKMKDLLADGTLGEMKRLVWIINNWYRSQAYYDSGEWRATWNGEGGGVLLNQCPHNLDLWQWIAGVPSRVRAFCRVAQYHEIQVEDDVTIYAEYANGANACFITSTGEYPGTNRLEISGTKGKAVLEEGKLKLWLLEKDEREICRTTDKAFPDDKVIYSEIVQTEKESGHLGILQNFADAILKGTELLSPGTEGIKSLSISNAAYLSQWTDAWVDLPLDGEVFAQHLKKQQENERTKANVKAEKEINPSGNYEGRWQIKW